MAKLAKTGRALFAVAVLSTLGLGASQALAGTPAATARVCYNSRCIMDCLEAGYEGGYCLDGECGCYGPPPNP